MPVFNTTYLDKEGNKQKTVIYAETAITCAKEIASRGHSVISLFEQKNTFWDKEFVSSQKIISFLHSLSFQTASSSSAKALRNVIFETKDKGIKKETIPALAALDKGETFGIALKATNLFSPITLAILETGEKTGKIKLAIDTAISQIERQSNVVKIISGVIAWVSIDIVFALSTATGIQTTLLPLLEKFGLKNATQAQALEYTRKIELLYTANGILIAVGTLLSFVFICLSAFIFLPNQNRFKKLLEPYVMRIPQLRSFFTNTALSDSFLIFGSLASGGVKSKQAFSIAEKSTGYDFMAAFWKKVADRFEYKALKISGAFAIPPLSDSEKSLIASHTDYASLSEAIKRISDNRFEAAKTDSLQIKAKMLFLVGLYSAASIAIAVLALILQDQAFTSFFKI